ncbi:MAG: M48 family metalloprotease [Alphaproteobacteria bacterium]|nr:M48 family metalloprotease [Alphaproteobacteria bacterium]MBL6951541.1 M48 family metalloprotease [Alphaproteobacteria bacterium]
MNAMPTAYAEEGDGSSWDTNSFDDQRDADSPSFYAPLSDLTPGYRPDKKTDEAGLWMVMDQVEAKLRRSASVVADQALRDYLQTIVCRLTPEYCPFIRLYPVRTAHFNATMAPNGTMQVWTGLLLRCQNEAQLAYILGHEISHYIRRHSLQRWRYIRGTGNVMAVLQLVTAGAGVGLVGDIAGLVALSTIFSYSRSHEREADKAGLALMAAAGYDPHEAAKAWQGLLEERETEEGKEKTAFFATHPPMEERIDNLNRQAKSLAEKGVLELGGDRYGKAVDRFRSIWLQDEVRRGQTKQSTVLLQRLAKGNAQDGLLLFYQGELLRRIGQREDTLKATDFYRRAINAGNAPPEVYRALGFASWDLNEIDRAIANFRAYLAAKPAADDREMILSYLEELKP